MDLSIVIKGIEAAENVLSTIGKLDEAAIAAMAALKAKLGPPSNVSFSAAPLPAAHEAAVDAVVSQFASSPA